MVSPPALARLPFGISTKRWVVFDGICPDISKFLNAEGVAGTSKLLTLEWTPVFSTTFCMIIYTVW